MAISDDGGRTFSAPIDMGGDVDASLTVPQMVVGPDGALFAYFGEFQGPPDAEEARLYLDLATSPDGGQTWAQDVIHTTPAGEMFAFLLTPSPAVNPQTGELYVVWEDTGERPPAVLFMRSAATAATPGQRPSSSTTSTPSTTPTPPTGAAPGRPTPASPTGPSTGG